MRPIFLLLLASVLTAPAADPIAIEIDLTAQKAYLLQDGKMVYETPISSGRSSHPTPTGKFKVTERDPNHFSSLYGKIVDASGKTVVYDGDSGMAVPPGGKFVRSPMKHFLRFDGATGMHAGRLPGYAASHGCVRLPPLKAELFYDIAEVGTPVRVHGKASPGGPTPAKTQTTPAPAPTPAPRKWWQILRRVTPAPIPVATPVR